MSTEEEIKQIADKLARIIEAALGVRGFHLALLHKNDNGKGGIVGVTNLPDSLAGEMLKKVSDRLLKNGSDGTLD